MKFGFAFEVEKALMEKSKLLDRIGEILSSEFERRNYGGGVKDVTVGVILTDPAMDHFFKVRKPKYYAGKKTLKVASISVEIEDVLEFEIKPNRDAIYNATSLAELAKAVQYALVEALPLVSKLKIPSFDMKQFQTDLCLFLSTLSAQERDQPM